MMRVSEQIKSVLDRAYSTVQGEVAMISRGFDVVTDSLRSHFQPAALAPAPVEAPAPEVFSSLER